MNTQRMSPRDEAKFAKGMVERRQAVVDNIGQEETSGEAWNNYQSMLACLLECEKHHNNVMAVIDDKTAGYGVETSALVDWSRKWVRQCEENLTDKWGVSMGAVTEKRDAIRYTWEAGNV